MDQYELQVCRLPPLPVSLSVAFLNFDVQLSVWLPGLSRRFLPLFSPFFFFQDVGAFGCSQVSLRLLKASRRVRPKSLRGIAIIISIERSICHSAITVRTIESDLNSGEDE